MPYAALESRLPEVARHETRSITTVGPDGPRRAYLFAEMFCNERGCDCRRAFIQVLSDEPDVPQPRAFIAYGWEPEQFYRDWASYPLDDDDLEELKGPALIRMAPQSDEAPELLEHFRTLLTDESYAARIVRHYEAFRAAVETARKGPSRKWRSQGRRQKRQRAANR